MSIGFRGAAFVLAALVMGAAARGETAPSPFDAEAAIRFSQDAVGRTLGEYRLRGEGDEIVSLARFRGRPLVINLVYTACTASCPVVVERLADAVAAAQGMLGADAFAVVTAGFDTLHDTPERMRTFARSHGIDLPNWRFLSADRATIAAMADDLGFVFYPSPRGFDHLAQTSVLDGDLKIFSQIYGDDFDPPALVEPLKRLRLGEPMALANIGGLIDRVRLFCTFFDPQAGRYRLDYSIVIGLLAGGLSLLGLAGILVRQWLGLRRTRSV